MLSVFFALTHHLSSHEMNKKAPQIATNFAIIKIDENSKKCLEKRENKRHKYKANTRPTIVYKNIGSFSTHYVKSYTLNSH